MSVDKMPFVPADWKQPTKGIIVVVAVFIVILALLGIMSGRTIFVM